MLFYSDKPTRRARLVKNLSNASHTRNVTKIQQENAELSASDNRQALGL